MNTDPSSLLQQAECYLCLGVTMTEALQLALLAQIATPPVPAITAPVLTVNDTFDVWHMVVNDNLPPNWVLVASGDGGATWTPVDTATYGVDINDTFGGGAWVAAQRGDAGSAPYGPMSNVIVMPSAPVLTANNTFDAWNLAVADNIPPNWDLQQSTDGGATWTESDNGMFGFPLSDVVASGTWVQAQRLDAGFVPYGATSNIIVVP